MGKLISDKFAAWQEECEQRFQQLKANEEELNRIFIDIYGLQDELTPEVEDKDVTVRRADLTREINAYQPGIGLDDEVSRTVYASAMLLLKPRKRVSLGYIVRNHMLLSPMAQAYIQAMEEYAEKYKQSHLT